jgi:hypothetical protein
MNMLDIPYYPEIQTHAYSSPFRASHLVKGDKEGQSPGERCVLSGPMSKATHPVRAYLFYFPRYGTQQRFSRTKGALLTAISW